MITKSYYVNGIRFMILFISILIMFSACSTLIDTPDTANPPDNIEDLQQGVVTYVIDGDTFDVKLEDGKTERVRPILVNAPEVCHDTSPSDCQPEPYSNNATDFTKDLLEGETIYLEQDVSERDPYDRLLAYVYLEDGRMYQELILAEGLATIAVYKPDTKYQSHLEKVEQKAKDQNINIWSDK